MEKREYRKAKIQRDHKEKTQGLALLKTPYGKLSIRGHPNNGYSRVNTPV